MDYLPDIIGGSDCEEDMPRKMTSNLEEIDVFEGIEIKPMLTTLPPSETINDVPVVKPRKKRIMTDDQKDKLAQARTKALQVRRENARLKREEKELLKMKKHQDLDALRNSVHKKVHISPVVEEHVLVDTMAMESKAKAVTDPSKATADLPKAVESKATESNQSKYKYTQDDVDRISLNAVENYDKIRKSRKVDKQKLNEETQIKERERQRLLHIVTGKTIGPTDFWGNCY